MQRSMFLLAGVALAVGACRDHPLTAPSTLPEAPADLARAIAESGIQTGPVSVFAPADGEGGRRYVVGRPGLRSPTSGEPGPRFSMAASEPAQLPQLFSVHPNGGTRNSLRSKEIHGLQPSASGGFIFGCIENGQFVQYLEARVDSLFPENFGTPTGGHGSDHDLSNAATGRPRGTFAPASGPTLPDGRFLSVYTPNIAAGDEKVILDYVVTDAAAPCRGIPARAEFMATVRVPGLVVIPADPDLILAPPSSHAAQFFWFLTPTTLQSTQALAVRHRQVFGLPLVLTAAALVQGGINDIGRNWDTRPGHWEHRVGTDVDIDDNPNTNDPDRLNEIDGLGEESGFAECEPHPRSNPNHVHCRLRRY